MTPTIHVMADPSADVEPVHSVTARAAYGLDAVEIRLRFDKATGASRALKLLARAAIEVLVHARAVKPVPASALEQYGRRWHG